MDKDTILLNIVNQIVTRHRCTITDIDLENHVISISGEPEDEETCAMELMIVLGDLTDEK